MLATRSMEITTKGGVVAFRCSTSGVIEYLLVKTTGGIGYTPPKGSLERADHGSTLACARRELEEETGLNDTTVQFLANGEGVFVSIEANPYTDRRNVTIRTTYYLALVASDAAITRNEQEIEDARWFSLCEACEHFAEVRWSDSMTPLLRQAHSLAQVHLRETS